MLSVRLYVSVSSIWANTPAIHSTHRPYSASLSPSNSPSACGWLLPFRQDPWFFPVGVRWLSCVMCVWEPSSSSFAAPPASLLRWCYWGVTHSSSPAVKTHWVQIPVCCTPSGNCFLKKGKTWKRGITETDQWMWYNKRKFWSACWKRGKKKNKIARGVTVRGEIFCDEQDVQIHETRKRYLPIFRCFLNVSREIGVEQ